MSASQEPLVLLVEDNEDDAFFLRRALKKAGLAVRLEHADTGRQALDYLLGLGEFADRERFPLPSLVLLDLKLPLLSGHEVLRHARAHRQLDSVCIVVLSSSAEPLDVAGAYDGGANSYLTKPAAAETLTELMEKIVRDWPACGPCGRLDLHRSERPRSAT